MRRAAWGATTRIPVPRRAGPGPYTDGRTAHGRAPPDGARPPGPLAPAAAPSSPPTAPADPPGSAKGARRWRQLGSPPRNVGVLPPCTGGRHRWKGDGRDPNRHRPSRHGGDTLLVGTGRDTA
ncbi:hypothetical protein Saso_15790 [Streptomyces asoensis]|uniref:Uncharacterized protein n=1 Tax=Streptomyces asoensis TaxID=249586 RepID=A0ABQ3RVN0_9ACTN|nr:hypothetical protein GCM10010496_37160 [Streptomyces asoensis]GHI59929.1 hypothetical protein Saso_15790 [Streptomyces asoensis]